MCQTSDRLLVASLRMTNVGASAFDQSVTPSGGHLTAIVQLPILGLVLLGTMLTLAAGILVAGRGAVHQSLVALGRRRSAVAVYTTGRLGLLDLIPLRLAIAIVLAVSLLQLTLLIHLVAFVLGRNEHSARVGGAVAVVVNTAGHRVLVAGERYRSQQFTVTPLRRDRAHLADVLFRSALKFFAFAADRKRPAVPFFVGVFVLLVTSGFEEAILLGRVVRCVVTHVVVR